MADQHAILDDVAFISFKEEESHLQLYTCMQNANDFGTLLKEKLKRSKKTSHDTVKKKQRLRAYLNSKIHDIADCLKVSVVTDIDNDHLLTVRHNNACFVYFAAMTAEFNHVACWLRVPLLSDGKINANANPQIFFWVLHRSYAQELEALGDLKSGVDMEKLKRVLDLTSIESS